MKFHYRFNLDLNEQSGYLGQVILTFDNELTLEVDEKSWQSMVFIYPQI